MPDLRLTITTDVLAQETYYYFYIDGYVYRTVYPDGKEEWAFRDEAKNLTKHIHPDGTAESFIYDDKDNLIEHIRPDQTRVLMAYDDKDQLIHITDPTGHEWLREYDAQGNLTKETDPLGHSTQYSYNPQGLPVAIKDAKIQLHWQRAQEHPEFGANLDDKSSCWVRVSMPSAGAGFGHQFIPRIGEEVLVDFIEGDIDRPIVTAVVHNGSHPPSTFSGAGSLPANKTLSGIKSKEFEGGQYGELLFDDSKGEVRTKLSSEHGKTQLNLGYLIHPRTDGKGEPRGEGFELRSDKQGAIRASGLLISTEAKGGASGKQLDRSPAQSQLESALETAKNLGEYATKQLADSIETGDDGQTIKPDNSAGDKATTGHLHHHVHASKSFEAGSNTDKDGKTKSKEQAGQRPEGSPLGGQKIILLHGEDGVAITSPQSQTLSAGTNLDLVAQRDTNQSTGRRWIHNVGQHISLFVGGVKDKITMKLIAAKGQLQMQAQSDDIEITGDKNVKLTAIKGKGLFNAKQEILLTAGGAYIRIKDGKIELHAPGKVSIKGGSHDWSGPASLNPPLPAFAGKAPAVGDIQLHHFYENMEGIKSGKYTLLDLNGNKHEGALDAEGKALVSGLPMGAISVAFQADPRAPKNQERKFDIPKWPQAPLAANKIVEEAQALSQLEGLIPAAKAKAAQLATQSAAPLIAEQLAPAKALLGQAEQGLAQVQQVQAQAQQGLDQLKQVQAKAEQAQALLDQARKKIL
ncbi:DUF2345 domain-containing protein [Iodobacter sp. CM08]|nr:DUF2345 domain-containing protein [Iodobacter sp. CM08]MDW5416632.1 DUF2345 domain-containing protein [Iodobacter sp. CM08]